MDIKALMAKGRILAAISAMLGIPVIWSSWSNLTKISNGQNKSHQAPHPHIQAVDRGGKEAFQLFFIEGVDLEMMPSAPSVYNWNGYGMSPVRCSAFCKPGI